MSLVKCIHPNYRNLSLSFWSWWWHIILSLYWTSRNVTEVDKPEPSTGTCSLSHRKKEVLKISIYQVDIMIDSFLNWRLASWALLVAVYDALRFLDCPVSWAWTDLIFNLCSFSICFLNYLAFCPHYFLLFTLYLVPAKTEPKCHGILMFVHFKNSSDTSGS